MYRLPGKELIKPLISKNGYEEGTGHNSVIKVDGEYYAVYHGRDLTPDERIQGDKRTARICKLIVKDGTITAIRKENEL